MNLLKDQADKLRDACRRLREATDGFRLANQALRFAERGAVKRTKKRTSGTAPVLQFDPGRKRQPKDDSEGAI